ncbi:hypothetical protein [Saccharobesus litoralis]|uniref:hypothetical protein n=1 Tax=Saccharobesus litoralis TaxID=2172099 RepID=UPI00131EEF8C|nr:hypothetical protein [Saccharobesus litoralis]
MFKLSPVWRLLLMAVGAFLIYASWTLWVNYNLDPAAAFFSAWVYGLYSFSITLLLSVTNEIAAKKLNHGARALAMFITVQTGFMIGVSYLVNYLAGTPDIIKTIALGAILSIIFSTSYVLGLRQSKLH